MGNREDTALTGTLIERDDVEVRPERLPAKVTDPSIMCIVTVRLMTATPIWRFVSRMVPPSMSRKEVSAKDKDMDLWELPHSCSCVGCDSCAFIALLRQLE